VPYSTVDMQQILAEVDTNLTGDRFSADYVCSSQEVRLAISRLNPHKDDGNAGLSSDYFINAGSDLSVHIAFLLTCIVVHGSVPKDFLTSSIIPIPKTRGGNANVSDNFRGIALSSVFGKILDNIILDKFQNQLNTSDLQFGFKSGSSTNMCTMVLKETISYYVKNKSSVFLYIFGRQ